MLMVINQTGDPKVRKAKKYKINHPIVIEGVLPSIAARAAEILLITSVK